MLRLDEILKDINKPIIQENDFTEVANDAYTPTKANGENMQKLWASIKAKQKNLQDMVFGELSDQLYDITKAKAKSMGEEYLQVPEVLCRAGNEKLPSSVLIVNMSSSLMCPSYYLGLCTITNGRCYAQQAENQHTNNVLPQRWKTDLMHTQMLQQYQKGNKNPMKEYFSLIEMYIQLGNAYAKNLYRKEEARMEKKLNRKLNDTEKAFLDAQQSENRITDVRLNETGDFQCQLAVDLWAKFARKIKKKYGVNTHAYTARNLDFSKASNDIAINPSHSGINLGSNQGRIFKAVGDDFYNKLQGGDQVENGQPILGEVNGKYFYKCPCKKGESHCDDCGVCFNMNKTGKPFTIYVRYHGVQSANGLRKLFTKNEVDGVIQALKNNGWVTDDEYETYNSPTTQNALDSLSKKVEKQRKTPTVDRRKKAKKNKATS